MSAPALHHLGEAKFGLGSGAQYSLAPIVSDTKLKKKNEQVHYTEDISKSNTEKKGHKSEARQ